MDAARAEPGDIDHGGWRRRGHGDAQPDQGRQSESRKSDEFENQRMARLEVMNHAEGEQENCAGNRSQNDEAEVDSPVQLLAGAATLADGEVMLVVATHLGRNAGNVVPPAGQDFPHHRINTLTHNQLKGNRFGRRMLSGKQDSVLQQRALRPQSVFRHLEGDFRMIVLLRQMRQYYV